MSVNQNQNINILNNKEVIIVGAGPGAEDLITLRGAKALEEADVVVYAGSLVSTVHLTRCKPTCETFDSANMSLDEQVAVMAKGIKDGKKVVRLHTGDPSMYGAINEQIRGLEEHGIKTSIVPGVSSVFAAAAALGCELTSPDISQSVVLTRTPGRTPMPAGEKASSFARTGATLVFFLSTANIESLMRNLMEEGDVSADTPTAVVYRASWPDERILRGTVSTITRIVQEAGLGRQALIFVGKAIGKNLTESKLYDAKFSHGYRNSLQREHFFGTCALYAFTDKALTRAQEIATGLMLPTIIYTTRILDNSKNTEGQNNIISLSKAEYKELFPQKWKEFDAHIFVSATGIAVRQIAPLLYCKTSDPAVLVCSENGAHVLSLVSGHIGGANRLARRVARITQGQAIISTATDINGIVAFDDIVAQEQARILNAHSLQYLNAALLHNEAITFCGDESVYARFFANNKHIEYKKNVQGIQTKYAILWDSEREAHSIEHVLHVTSKNFILGVGCKRDTPTQELEEKFEQFLAENNIRKEQIARMASCDLKKDEKAILDLVQKNQFCIDFYSAEELDSVEVPNPSNRVFSHTNTHSVSEAASLLSAGYEKGKENNPKIRIPKTAYGTCTFCVTSLPHERVYIEDNNNTKAYATQKSDCIACESKSDENKTSTHKKGCVIVVGVGSGSSRHITPEVSEAIEKCDTIAGYSNYIDLVADRVAGKTIIRNGMMGEVKRCQDTLDAALNGQNVCMICSGDPGILAMAGLLFELRARESQYKDVSISVLPGITSANIAAATLGAPLQNGFSLVSLSDLLVPSEEVRQNLNAVAQSALPVALYNPAGKKRRELLAEALGIFKAQRGEDIWCATVRHAGREEESTWVGKLKDFPLDNVDMSTLVIIGGYRTKYSSGILYEARGYVDKYLKG